MSNELPAWQSQFICAWHKDQSLTFRMTMYSNTGVRSKDVECEVCGRRYKVKWLEDTAEYPDMVSQYVHRKKTGRRKRNGRNSQPTLFPDGRTNPAL